MARGLVMTISLTPEQEKIVEDELRSGNSRTVEEVIGKALQALKQRETASSQGVVSREEQEAVRRMLEFAEQNRTRLDGLSVKYLIHEGHRL
jgi:Arc/MetJ-type ribon-helix-helix transcriptional regulator